MKASKTILPHLAESANFVASPGRRACPNGQGPQDAGGLPAPHTPRHRKTVPAMTSTLTDNDPARIIDLGSTLHDAARWSHACGHQVVPSLWLATFAHGCPLPRCSQRSSLRRPRRRRDLCVSGNAGEETGRYPEFPRRPLAGRGMTGGKVRAFASAPSPRSQFEGDPGPGGALTYRRSAPQYGPWT